MTWRHSFRKIYCLDTLDTRFSIPANVPPKHANTELQEVPAVASSSTQRVSKSRPDGAPTQSLPDAKPSLWGTWEFYVYYFVFITCVPLMFKAVYDVSQRRHSSCSISYHFVLISCDSEPSFISRIRTFTFSWMDTWPQSCM